MRSQEADDTVPKQHHHDHENSGDDDRLVLRIRALDSVGDDRDDDRPQDRSPERAPAADDNHREQLNDQAEAEEGRRYDPDIVRVESTEDPAHRTAEDERHHLVASTPDATRGSDVLG